MFDLILFDLDGTLVDTAPEIADTVNEVLESIGLPALPAEQIRDWIGHGARETVRHAWTHVAGEAPDDSASGVTLDDLMLRFAEIHSRRCGTNSRLFPGVRTALESLRQQGVAMAVLTNKESRFSKQVLECHGIDTYFDPIISGDTLAERKPSAVPAGHCLARHGVEPARALLVGDSSVDAETARNAGIRFWAVPYGYNGGVPIADAQPDRILQSLDELVAVFDGSPQRMRRGADSPASLPLTS